MNTKSEINSFLKEKRFALVGVSENPKKFSRMIMKELTAKGYEVLPVNPKLDDLDGKKVYHNVSELPGEVNCALFMTPKDITPSLVEEASKHGIENLWIQQGAHSDESKKLATEIKGKIIHNKCIMMFADPVKGVHGFHRFLTKLFNKMPN